MRNIIKLIVASCIICIISCENLADHGIAIRVNNKTNAPVNFIFSTAYPDTSLPEKNDNVRYAGAMGEGNFEFNGYGTSELFKGLKSDTLSVFIISHDTLTKYSWDQIRSEYKILKRYDVSRHNLDTGRNTITYP